MSGDSTMSSGLPLTLAASRPRPDVCVVALSGELDVATVQVLAEFLREQTATTQPAHLVLDMAAVGFLASAGVALIVTAQRDDAGIHGQLHLVGLTHNRPVTRVLDLTGVLPFLDVHDDLDHLLNELDQA
jgi:anti-sigma B factor antagonist